MRPRRQRAPYRERSKHNVYAYSFDLDKFDALRHVREVSKAIVDLARGDEHTGRPPVLTAEELVRDIWLSLFRPSPLLMPKSHVHADALVNRSIVEAIMDSESYQGVHDAVYGNAEAAARVMAELMPTIHETLIYNAQAVKAANEYTIRARRVNIHDDPNPGQPSTSPTQQTGPKPPPPPGVIDELDVYASQLGGKADYEVIADEIDDQRTNPEPLDPGSTPGDGAGDGTGEGEPDELSDFDLDAMEEMINSPLGIESALARMEEDLQRAERSRSAAGISPGEWAALSDNDRREYADVFTNPRYRKMLEMIGRQVRTARNAIARKIVDAHEEAFDVTTGDRVQDALTSELALLARPETKYLFYAKVANKELLTWRKRGKAQADKGPIVCCVDRSGSMGGARMDFAVGLVGALRMICKEQNRDLHVIFFDFGIRKEFSFTTEDPNTRGFLEMMRTQAGGGTEVTKPLTRALDLIGDDKVYDQADILLLTDGAVNFDQSFVTMFNSAKEEKNARLFSLFIGSSVSSFEPISDSMTALREMAPSEIDHVYRIL